MKIAFLDRDGTIVRDYDDDDWKGKIVPDVLEGAIEGMLLLNQRDYKIIVITNQYIINDGIISIDQYNEFTSNLKEIFEKNGVEVLDIFYCPHSTSENCECKKPKVGMVQKALEKYPHIDLSQSILMGDSKADEELALNVNLKFYKIGIKLNDTDRVYDSINEVVLKNNL